MHWAMGSGIFSTALAALAAQGASAAPATFDPTGPWTSEVSEGICLVGRTYGTGDQQVTVAFRQLPNAEDVEIGVWVADPSEKGSHGLAQLRLDQAAPIDVNYIKGPVSIKGLHLIWIDTTRAQLADLPAASSMAITAGNVQARIKLRNVAGAMKALAECERKLLVSWGMDPAVLDSIETPPQGKLARFFNWRDYPKDSIIMNKQGTSGVRFRVAEDGSISDCKVVASSGTSVLDSRSCAILTRRGKLEPARDKNGNAVSSISFARIRWEIARYR